MLVIGTGRLTRGGSRVRVGTGTGLSCSTRADPQTFFSSSGLLIAAWKKVVSDCDLPAKILPRDVKTRWNSTYDMIITALQYRRAYREFTTDEPNGLQKFVLTAA